MTRSLATLACLTLTMSLAAAQEGSWTNLLEGNDLKKGWFTTGNWKIDKEGVVALEPRKGESGWTRYDAYLWAKKQYKDFEIDFEYKVTKGGNSGFYFRVGDLKEPVKNGIEVQIYDSFGAKGLSDHTSGGIIPGIPPKSNAAKAPGEWNRFQITSKDNKVTVKLNGEVVNEAPLDKGGLKSRPATGYIGFQDHGLPLWLRNIKIREL